MSAKSPRVITAPFSSKSSLPLPSKKAKMRLITTNHPRPRRIPDIWCHGFSRYLGRQLTPAEKIVISALEKAAPPVPHPSSSSTADTTTHAPSSAPIKTTVSPPHHRARQPLLCTPDNPKRPGASHVCDTSPTGASKPSEAPPLIHAPARRPPCPHLLTPHTRHPQLPPRLLHTLPHPRPSGFLVIHLRLDPGHPTDATQATSLASQSQRLPARITATRHSHHHPRH